MFTLISRQTTNALLSNQNDVTCHGALSHSSQEVSCSAKISNILFSLLIKQPCYVATTVVLCCSYSQSKHQYFGRILSHLFPQEVQPAYKKICSAICKFAFKGPNLAQSGSEKLSGNKVNNTESIRQRWWHELEKSLNVMVSRSSEVTFWWSSYDFPLHTTSYVDKLTNSAGNLPIPYCGYHNQVD